MRTPNHATMKHSKVIVLNGFSRGGTNIAWNLLQSHPDVCSPILETGELLYRRLFRLLPKSWTRRMLSQPRFLDSIPGRLIQQQINQLFYRWKLKNLGHRDNGMKDDGVPYTAEEVKRSVLCLKSTNFDIDLIDCFQRMYSDVYCIGLVRDGYSLCEGRVRRGQSAEVVGQQYRQIGQQMIDRAGDTDRFLLLRFDDVLADPFATAERLYAFCKLQPLAIPKLRLKSKRILTADKKHKPLFGEVNRKYWFDRISITDVLDQKIDQVQASQLSPADLAQFEKHALPVLEYLGYAADGRQRQAAA